jgi:hypothetical protein
MDHINVRHNGKPVCDFCCATPVLWCYPAKSFVAWTTKHWVGESVAEWAACGPCHDLIEKDDRAGLLNRSVRMFLKAKKKLPEIEGSVGIGSITLRISIGKAHNGFFRHRNGEAVRVA